MCVDLVSDLIMLAGAQRRNQLTLALHTIFNNHGDVLIRFNIWSSSRAGSTLETRSHCRNRYIAFIRHWCFVTLGFGQLAVLGVVE